MMEFIVPSVLCTFSLFSILKFNLSFECRILVLVVPVPDRMFLLTSSEKVQSDIFL